MADIASVYGSIAKKFSGTRHTVWKAVQNFIDTFQESTINADIGCGNGKNMFLNKQHKFKGIDICDEFVNECQQKKLDVIKGDILKIPFDDNLFDNVICIAVIHHLQEKTDRINAIRELIRITKPTGQILISVWAFEQPDDSKRKFDKQDNMVPFKNSDGTCVERFYHVYVENELKSDIENIGNIIIKNIFIEKGNWFALIQKSTE